MNQSRVGYRNPMNQNQENNNMVEWVSTSKYFPKLEGWGPMSYLSNVVVFKTLSFVLKSKGWGGVGSPILQPPLFFSFIQKKNCISF